MHKATGPRMVDHSDFASSIAHKTHLFLAYSRVQIKSSPTVLAGDNLVCRRLGVSAASV
ncbi:hypothetical protein BaRGS_00025468, partial [Batillaria attramentaria]